MRSTIVPAQVTTVEDKVTGKLGLTQLVLLTVPIFGGGLLYVLLPPFYGYSIYKVVVLTTISAICGMLAIRFKGKLLLSWVTVITLYNIRPRFYVFNKNDMHQRPLPIKTPKPALEPTKKVSKSILKSLPQITTAELVRVESFITNPKAHVHFKVSRKGGLSVHFTEVQR